MKTGIYRIVHRDSGRCYVGQARDIGARWRQHRFDLAHGKHHSRYLQRSWDKHGEEAFDFEMLEPCSADFLTVREQHWADLLDSVFNSREIVDSNAGLKRSSETRAKIAAAGRGRVTSEETKEKLRLAVTGQKRGPETAAKHRAWHREVGFSPEARERIAAGQRGRKHSPERIAKALASRKAFYERKHAQTA